MMSAILTVAPIGDNVKSITIENPDYRVEAVTPVDDSIIETIGGSRVEDIVRAEFAKTPILIQVAKCESRFHQLNKDGSVTRGIENHDDVGVMQINEKYHLARAQKLGIDIYTLEGNIAYAKLLYKDQGTDPWSASSPCWDK